MRIINPRVLGLIIFVATILCCIEVQSSESHLINIKDNSIMKTHRILISGFSFKPEVLNVNIGDKIIWVNKDIAPHNIVKSNKETGISTVDLSPDLMRKGEFEFIIKESFNYYCGFHPSMTGRIIIIEK